MWWFVSWLCCIHISPRIITSGNVEQCWKAGARPNLGFARFGLHNVLSAHSFPFVTQDRLPVAVTCVVYNGEQVSRTVLTLCFQSRCSWHASICTSNPSLFLSCTFEPWRLRASASHWRLHSMPSNGGEFSGWLDRLAHISRRVKMCKNFLKRLRSQKPCIRTYTTYGRTYINRKIHSNERVGWLAPANISFCIKTHIV